MTKADAVLYFGGVKRLADVIGVGMPAISNWGDYPPDTRQIQIEYLTSGFLRAEPGLFRPETELERKTRRKAYRAAIKQTMRRHAA